MSAVSVAVYPTLQNVLLGFSSLAITAKWKGEHKLSMIFVHVLTQHKKTLKYRHNSGKINGQYVKFKDMLNPLWPVVSTILSHPLDCLRASSYFWTTEAMTG
jgi:hypothetical protein